MTPEGDGIGPGGDHLASRPYADRPRPAQLGFWRDLSVVLAVVVAGLVLGASLLIPLAFALLVFVLLTAIIDWVAARGVPRPLAHLSGVGIVVLGLGGVLSILVVQAEQIMAALPRYQDRFADIVSRVVALVGEENALLVEEALLQADLSPVAFSVLGEAGALLSGFFLVMLYVPFLMVERGPLARKLQMAAPDPSIGRQIADVNDEMNAGLRRYVGVKTFVSALTGLFSYAVFKPLGLDFAETWALLAFALNFIPSIGSILGVVLPALVALVQFDGVWQFVVIAVGCGLVQFSIGNILEPALTGRSLNVSPLVVILALTFWTAIWGVPGALMSVPITVCLLIMFSHIPAARPVAVLLSRDGRIRGGAEDAAQGAKTSAAGMPAEDG